MPDELQQCETAPRANPFSARRVRPGATPFIFPPGENVELLLRRLDENGWRGEIVGPHGAGKSTLLAELLPALQRAGRKPLAIELHDRQRRLPLDLKGQFRRAPFDLVIVDGFEQLSRWSRLRLKLLCRRRGWGLLAAVHRSVGLPLLYRVAATSESAAKLVARLTEGCERTPSEEELKACFSRHRGNLRETLFELYDWFEGNRPE
ncbi:MAG: hypothetical protein JW959_13910 [Pirellulales bacterium]|nr:hypothetical protein [Pirellulales bacterium]